MKETITKREFDIISFKDSDNTKCSIQKDYKSKGNCIFLGSDEVKIYGITDRRFKISEEEIRKKFELNDIETNSRIKLNRYQVRELIPILQKFVDSGSL